MGSEVPSAVLFSEGRSPEEIVGSGRNRRPIDSTGASKKGMIYLFYIPHQQHLLKLPVTFTFYVGHFPLNFATPTCMHACAPAKNAVCLTLN